MRDPGWLAALLVLVRESGNLRDMVVAHRDESHFSGLSVQEAVVEELDVRERTWRRSGKRWRTCRDT